MNPVRKFWLRGKKKITVMVPWWNVPRCFFCNRILWPNVITITVDDKTVCYECEREERTNRHSMRELNLFFGKPEKVEVVGEAEMTFFSAPDDTA